MCMDSGKRKPESVIGFVWGVFMHRGALRPWCSFVFLARTLHCLIFRLKGQVTTAGARTFDDYPHCKDSHAF